MTRSEMEKIVEEGLCSLESIEEAKRLSEQLDSDDVQEKIVDAERVLKALSDRTRIKLLMLLARGEMCVCQITAVTDAPQPTISNTLRLLENARLVKREQRGRWHFYSLADNRILKSMMEMLEDGN